MSVQILLQGKLSGAAGFLLSGAPEELLLTGRSHWVSLLSEVLPRALIAELGLSRILLGSSGGGQFLAVLPGEFRTRADEFLAAARAGIGISVLSCLVAADYPDLVRVAPQKLSSLSDLWLLAIRTSSICPRCAVIGFVTACVREDRVKLRG